jgi:hypothetical protein
VQSSVPCIYLGPGWYGWLEFGPDNRHATFAAIGDRVACELGGTVQALMPNRENEGKEYADIVVGNSRLLLMRKTGIGIALGAACPDLPLLLQIAALFQAECRGWRWPLYRLWRRATGRGA